MRIAGMILTAAVSAIVAASPILMSAQAQSPTPVAAKKKAAPKPKAAKKSKADKKGEPKGVPGNYASMPIAERAAIQFDLNWTNNYSGQADGQFNERSVTAVRAFQKARNLSETGVLDDSQRAALASAAQARRERVGWRMVEDRATGAQVGIPTKLASHESRMGSGTRWQSAQGQLQIITFRIREPGATLATVFADQKNEPPSRRLASSALHNHDFILTGMQGLKYFLVRAEVRDLEIRGVTVLYDQAIESTTDYVGLAVLSAFAPFPGSGVTALIGPPSRNRIEYGSGIVVTAGGHIVTDRQLTQGCDVLEIAGQGDASRLAEQNNVALLRVFGAGPLTPAALVHAGVRLSPLTLVGIADPQVQAGQRAASAAPATLSGEGLDPRPQLGFAGAAALDDQGRIAGMVSLKSAVLAGGGSTMLPPATIEPIAMLREFLDAQGVELSSGAAGVDAVKASIVRVICVRR
jgi:peptidoglycan hydrolase-like protein with peptidoglycan-binding domain